MVIIARRAKGIVIFTSSTLITRHLRVANMATTLTAAAIGILVGFILRATYDAVDVYLDTVRHKRRMHDGRYAWHYQQLETAIYNLAQCVNNLNAKGQP